MKRKNTNNIIIKICIVMLMLLSTSLFCTKADAASNTNWKTVEKNKSYVKYGKYKIRYSYGKMHIKGKNINTTIKVSYEWIVSIITDGTRIIYQKENTIYQWTPKSTKKLFTQKLGTLIGRYGNNYYFAHWNKYEESRVYIYNPKTGKLKKTKLINGFCINGKYMLAGGDFHEPIATPLNLYNMQSGKTIKIEKSKYLLLTGSIKGNYVYYTVLANNYQIGDSRAKYKDIKYNIKTGKKTVIKKAYSVSV